jgi:hypothetical protein
VSEAERHKTVVVLGAARSGTSVTAGILEALGVDMGSIGASKKWNPKGSFEDKDFQRLNKAIFRMVEPSKDYWEPPSWRQVMDQRAAAAPKIRELVAAKSRRERVWGWKNPRSILTLELYLPCLTNPHLVLVSRDRLATAKSSIKHTRGRIDLPQALRLVDFYTGEMHAFVERHPELPNISIAFEEIVADPKKEAERLAAFLGLEPTEEKLAKVYQLIVPRERIEAAKTGSAGGFKGKLSKLFRKRG